MISKESLKEAQSLFQANKKNKDYVELEINTYQKDKDNELVEVITKAKISKSKDEKTYYITEKNHLDDKYLEPYAVLNPEYKKIKDEKQYNFYLKYSRIPKDYWDIDINNIQLDEALKNSAKEFIQNIEIKKTNLYLFSKDNSTGKTSLMCAIGKELLKKGLVCYFGLAKEVQETLMKTSGFSQERYAEEEFEERRKIKQADVLLIDDVFDPNKATLWKGESKSIIVSEWDTLLRHSTSEGKRIILTSNSTLRDVGNEYSKDLYYLLDRNFKFIQFSKSIADIRKNQI